MLTMTEQQAPAASLGQTDQAAGLRQLFGEGLARVWCLVSSLPGDPTVMVALGAANALRRAGQRVLLVDEVPLTNRNLLGGTPYPVRYDLGQVFSGSISIDKAVRQVGDKLWYCVATKLRRAKEDKKAKLPTLAERLLKAGIDVDVVIVASTDPHRATHQLYADDMNHILISGTDEGALDKSLHMVHELAVLFGGSAIPVLTVGGGSSEAGNEGFESLQARSYELMDQPLEHQGWVRAMQFASADEETGEMIVPASLYRMMAGRIFPEGVLQDHSHVNGQYADPEGNWDKASGPKEESSEFAQ
jgi:methylmalonyl-CoA mutase cobalamin-binding subunit